MNRFENPLATLSITRLDSALALLASLRTITALLPFDVTAEAEELC